MNHLKDDSTSPTASTMHESSSSWSSRSTGVEEGAEHCCLIVDDTSITALRRPRLWDDSSPAKPKQPFSRNTTSDLICSEDLNNISKENIFSPTKAGMKYSSSQTRQLPFAQKYRSDPKCTLSKQCSGGSRDNIMMKQCTTSSRGRREQRSSALEESQVLEKQLLVKVGKAIAREQELRDMLVTKKKLSLQKHIMITSRSSLELKSQLQESQDLEKELLAKLEATKSREKELHDMLKSTPTKILHIILKETKANLYKASYFKECFEEEKTELTRQIRKLKDRMFQLNVYHDYCCHPALRHFEWAIALEQTLRSLD
jgi:hypothetical protein